MQIVSSPISVLNPSRRGCHGTTLIEMLTTMGIFGFAMSALLAAYLFGLKQDQLAQSKLGASDESRRSFERVARDIRCANNHAVGYYNVSTTNFTPIVNGTNQVGNALRIYLTATNSKCIIYYFNTNSSPGTWTLNRVHTGDAPSIIASHLQNSGTFSAENFSGTVQSTMLDKDVIHFTLDFCEYQYPKTLVGANYYYDRYVVDFRATPHVPGGK